MYLSIQQPCTGPESSYILFLNTMVLTEKKSTERYICCSRRPINDQQSQCYVRMPCSGGLYPQGKFMCYFYTRRFPLRETHVTLYCNFIFNGLTKVIKSPEECTTYYQMIDKYHWYRYAGKTLWSRKLVWYLLIQHTIVRLINVMKQKWLLRHFMESNEHDFETCLSELIV